MNMKKIFILISILSLFILTACKKKTTESTTNTCVVNLCYINYDNIMDNHENLDVIDEGCKMGKVEKWKNVCEINKTYKFKIEVFEGYYISRYTITDTYSIENATFITEINDNIIEITPTSFINYIIVDFKEVE